MTILYNCHHDGDQYRITKFNDGAVESSYLTDGRECDCPAGARATCRHRQMLPQMIHSGIVNTHWFLEWDHKGGVVDINGVSKTALDHLAGEDTEQDTASPAQRAMNAIYPPNLPPTVVQTVDSEVLPPGLLTTEDLAVRIFAQYITPKQTVDPVPAGLHGEACAPTTQPWRRM